MSSTEAKIEGLKGKLEVLEGDIRELRDQNQKLEQKLDQLAEHNKRMGDVNEKLGQDRDRQFAVLRGSMAKLSSEFSANERAFGTRINELRAAKWDAELEKQKEKVAKAKAMLEVFEARADKERVEEDNDRLRAKLQDEKRLGTKLGDQPSPLKGVLSPGGKDRRRKTGLKVHFRDASEETDSDEPVIKKRKTTHHHPGGESPSEKEQSSPANGGDKEADGEMDTDKDKATEGGDEVGPTGDKEKKAGPADNVDDDDDDDDDADADADPPDTDGRKSVRARRRGPGRGRGRKTKGW